MVLHKSTFPKGLVCRHFDKLLFSFFFSYLLIESTFRIKFVFLNIFCPCFKWYWLNNYIFCNVQFITCQPPIFWTYELISLYFFWGAAKFFCPFCQFWSQLNFLTGTKNKTKKFRIENWLLALHVCNGLWMMVKTLRMNRQFKLFWNSN